VIIVPAEEADLPRLLKFRTDAANWLHAKGTDQWASPFPAGHILASIRRGEVYMIRKSARSDAVATITLDHDADPRLWTPAEIAEPALYVHKLAVDRACAGAGLGAMLLEGAGVQAIREGAHWLRLDAWTTNRRLQEYYLGEGFAHVRTVDDPDVVSGWTAQRPAAHQAHPEAPHPVWTRDGTANTAGR